MEHYPGAYDIFAMDLITDPNEVPNQERLPRLTNGSKFSHHDKLQDVLFEKLGGESDIKIRWSIHRPAKILFGFSPLTSYSSMNFLVTLAVYPAICKKEGTQFRFPGNSITWEGHSEASDAELIAEQQIWACVEPNEKNKVFNVSNEDVFRWKNLWTVVAEKLEVEAGDYEGCGFSLAEEMKSKSHVWEEIVKEKGLVESKLEEVGEQWWLSIDRILNRSLMKVVSMSMSMKKSNYYGFPGFRNTEKSCLEWINMLKTHKIIP